MPTTKRSAATLAAPSGEAAPFIYPPEWPGVVWFDGPASGPSLPTRVATVVGQGVLIAAAVLVGAILLAVALGVAADAAVVIGGVR